MGLLLKNKKILTLIVVLQEAFSAIIPFFLLSSFLTLFYILVKYFNISYINLDMLGKLSVAFSTFSSLVANIAIAYFFAIRIKVSPIISSILSIATFITIVLIENNSIILPAGFTPITILNPLFSVMLLKWFYPKFSLNLSILDGNYHVYRLFNYLFVFVISYFVMILGYMFCDYFLDHLIDYLATIHFNITNVYILVIRDFFVQFFWFFGIHGEHVVNGFFGKDILFTNILPNLTFGEFHRMFVNIGGAGIGLSIALALLLYAKDKTIKLITKLSLPFIIFNIDTLIIYAIVVVNRYILIPFLLLPLFNLLVSYLFIHFVNIDFTTYYVAWNSPIFVDVYLKTDGNYLAILFQIFLVVIDTLIYSYFIKQFLAVKEISNHFDMLKDSLEIVEEIKAKESIKSFQARNMLIEANLKLSQTIKSINKDNLFVYYQPKVDIKNRVCNKFEALIRYRVDGVLKGPVFLDIIEQAGLAPIVDIWVSKMVKKDLQNFKTQNFFPQISVNLHPDTLKSKDAIEKILDILDGENIVFEIIERSFVYKEASTNLQLLKQRGFKISIDDFGVGYSSLETITKYQIDELKIDKSLIDLLNTKNGYIICKHSVMLCHEIGVDVVVAEGVEDETQLQLVKEIDIDVVQGYYFSKAIEANKVIDFVKNLKFS